MCSLIQQRRNSKCLEYCNSCKFIFVCVLIVIMTGYYIKFFGNYSFNTCLSKTHCKVKCVIGMLKKKFPCLNTPLHYQPTEVSHIVKACGFLWNFGLLTGDNQGYDLDEFIVEDGHELKQELSATTGGVVHHNTLCRYLWAHKN